MQEGPQSDRRRCMHARRIAALFQISNAYELFGRFESVLACGSPSLAGLRCVVVLVGSGVGLLLSPALARAASLCLALDDRWFPKML